MTFEEISSIFDAFEINLEIVQPYAMEFSSVREAHGFAQAGGVMGAVKAFLKMEADKINAIQVSDLNKKNIGTLRAYAKSGKSSRTIHRSDGLRGWLYHRTQYAQRQQQWKTPIGTGTGKTEKHIKGMHEATD